jgi:quercetin 2,3-dioxygenase
MVNNPVLVRRAGDRARTRSDWLDSRHSFSFGRHYDPGNTHFGLLLVSNDDVVAPGGGFATHPHRDMEIVTWVVDGELAHTDSAGNSGVIYPGLAQRMSAGSGIRHSETNPAGRPVRFIQMWVRPDTEGGPPGYAQLDINPELARGGLVPVASGRPSDDAALSIRQRDARLLAGRLRPGESVDIPDAPYVHLFVVRGAATLTPADAPDAAEHLSEGDAARLSAAAGHHLRAAPSGTELLLWSMTAPRP